MGVVIGLGVRLCLDPGARGRLARRGRRPGPSGRLMHSYMLRQWVDDEAIAWASHGIDAGDAGAWKELGLTPVEAERQQALGLGAMQTAKAWWRAGIPVDEVALRRPTLDDAFLALTGGRHRRASRRSPQPQEGRGPGLFSRRVTASLR